MPLRFSRPVTALIATGTVAISIGLPAAPASADQVRQSEYWLRTLDVTSAWATSRGSGVTVAVLSDGVSPSQLDLTGSVTSSPPPAGAPIASGQYFGEQGTAIASLIAGHGHGPGRNAGIIGVAPLARILSVPVTLPADDPELSQTAVAAAIPAAIAAGIRYAVDHGANVIDLPIDPSQPGITGTGTGGAAAATGDSAAEQSAVAYALRHDAVLVAPAGDNGAATDAPNYPAAYPGVIAVGAFNQAFDKAAWSSHQSYVTVTAAGAGVIAASGSGYQAMNSTSAASAVVSGVVALIRASYPQLTVAEVRKALITSTLYRRSGGLADGSGYGAVDADKALAAAGRLATSLAHRAGAGAPPGQLPSGSPASPGTQSVGAQILQAAKISAGVLALLLLLIGGYVAVGRRRRNRQPVAATEWPHRRGQPRYPTASPADADPRPEVFSGAMAKLQRAPSQLGTASQSDAALFAPATRRQSAEGAGSAQLALPAGGGPARMGGSRLAGALGSGAAGPVDAGGPGAVSPTPPWAPASPPDSDLPWTAAPRSRPGARAGQAPAASTEQPWLTASAEQFLGPSGGRFPRQGQPSGPGGTALGQPGGAQVTGAGGPSGAGPAEPGQLPGVGGHARHSLPAQAPSFQPEPWFQPEPSFQAEPFRAEPSFPPEPPPGSEPPAPPERPFQVGRPVRASRYSPPSFTSEQAQPGWTPQHRRPDPVPPAASPEPATPPTAPSGLPVRQPGANAPRPLSPSGSVWDAFDAKRADQGDDDEDPGGRPVYMWNP